MKLQQDLYQCSFSLELNSSIHGMLLSYSDIIRKKQRNIVSILVQFSVTSHGF
jgi:hypothetical protein